MTPDAAKAKSESFLREHGIAINSTLPTIETLDELTPQSARSVATRAIVLSYMIRLGFGQSGNRMKQSLVEYGLLDAITPIELDLLDADSITEQDKINCTWLTECVQSLGYCLGLTELDAFRPCDNNLASRFPAALTDPTPFIESATLRSFDDIYSQADLHYRMHWATRNARLTGSECPIQEGLISERRKALDWVIGVAEDWDEISMDT